MKAVGEMGAAMNAALIVIGDKLGLYKAMAGAGRITSAELAAKTDTTERYVREWLAAQAAGGFVTYDAASQNGTPCRPSRPWRWPTKMSPVFLAGLFSNCRACLKDDAENHRSFSHGQRRRLARARSRAFSPAPSGSSAPTIART